jgi:ABC-2 type transport system permease protein
MNKILIIIQREYITRVKKKSFIIMTLLAPILMGCLFLVAGLTMTTKDKTVKKIAVVDDNADAFRNVIPNLKDAQFEYLPGARLEDLKKSFDKAGYYAILYIGPVGSTGAPIATQLVFKKNQPPIDLLEHIQNTLGKEIERQKLLAYKIKNIDSIMNAVKTRINISTIQIDEKGAMKKTSTGISMALAYLGGFLMYMLVFIFGAQVMRGVIEEKTSRVVEVIISSVKPVQLMMGKIVGIALVGLTQFLIWIILTGVSVTVLKSTVLQKSNVSISQTVSQNLMSPTASQNLMSPSVNTDTVQQVSNLSPQQAEFYRLFDSAMNQNWPLIIFSFVFYFLTGYLLYASIFAAIGSAVDNETETQQFMLPVTIPIIFALLVAMGTMRNPESPLAFWCSLIPLTSPIVMMARIPFGVPYWQLGLSMILMVVTFIAFVWMAAKIYRTGILMYGKKTSWKEMWKWLKYSG